MSVCPKVCFQFFYLFIFLLHVETETLPKLAGNCLSFTRRRCRTTPLEGAATSPAAAGRLQTCAFSPSVKITCRKVYVWGEMWRDSISHVILNALCLMMCNGMTQKQTQRGREKRREIKQTETMRLNNTARKSNRKRLAIFHTCR